MDMLRSVFDDESRNREEISSPVAVFGTNLLHRARSDRQKLATGDKDRGANVHRRNHITLTDEFRFAARAREIL